MFTQMRNLNLKFISVIIFAVTFLVGGFFVFNNAKAATMGDIIINEFVSNSETEWIELLNRTEDDIPLAGWRLIDGNNDITDDLDLSGTIPASGIIVFEHSKGWLNDGGDLIILNDGSSNLIYSVSYGTVNPGQGVPHSSTPTSGNSAYISIYDPLTYSTTAIPSKGWFNNTVDFTCPSGVLTDPSGSTTPPTLSSIASCLSSDPTFVTTNMGTLTNPSAATGLYFEKSVSGSPVGKITFAGPLNLTDSNTVNYLKAIGAKMEASQPNGGVKVGLNTSDTSSFSGISGTVKMYGVTTATTPTLIVKNNAGEIITSGADYPTITPGTFSDADDTYEFTTSHFTTFETEIPITAIDTITGTPKVGTELTAGVLTPSGATASYQWQIATETDGTYANISGATTNKYTPVTGDLTKFLKVVATGTGSFNSNVTSTATTAITAPELDSDQTTPNETGDATSSPTTPEVVITDPDQPVEITITDGTENPTIDVSALVDLVDGEMTGTLPEINITSDVADILIPDNTVVTGPSDWDGIIDAPTEGTPAGGNAPAGFSVGDTVISIGSDAGTLYFDTPVSITLTGVTGTVGYRPADSNTWQTIDTQCNSAIDPSNISSGECYFHDGGNTIIWTYHFTSFGELDPVSSHSSSGSYVRPVVKAPVVNTTPVVGKVLGTEKFNFTRFIKFKMGSYRVRLQGNEVIELQKFLNTLGYTTLIVDGKFGPKTKGAVIKFQNANGLKGDGIVGALTRAVLNK